MLCMSEERRKPKNRNPWPARLKKLRDSHGLTNEDIAKRLRIPLRLWKSWLYDNRIPSAAAQALISLLQDGKIRD